MGEAPVRTPVRERKPLPPSRWVLMWATLGGLLLTPLVYTVVGRLFFVDRTTSGTQQSDEIGLALMSLLMAFVGAIYWCGAAAVIRAQGGGAWRWWAALGLFVLVAAGIHLTL